MDIAVSYHESLTKLQALDWPQDGPFDRLEWFGLLGPVLAAMAERGHERVHAHAYLSMPECLEFAETTFMVATSGIQTAFSLQKCIFSWSMKRSSSLS